MYDDTELRGLTDRACAAFSSGDALGSNWYAAPPAFFVSSTMVFSASPADTAEFGSLAASRAPSDFSSASREKWWGIVNFNWEVPKPKPRREDSEIQVFFQTPRRFRQ